MITIGKYNKLEVVKELDFGIYLKDVENDGDLEILMPSKWVPQDTKIGDLLDVFIFRDSDDRIIATTIKPLATADSFAFLEVKQVNDTGAFLDWGMDKDLLVPFREQARKMEPGKSYIVFVYVDKETDRLVASSKLNRYIEREIHNLEQNDIVDLLIYAETDMGYNAIVNDLYGGLIYKNEIFETIRVGDRMPGFVKNIREDDKIDLSLQKSGFELVDDVKWRILNLLKQNDGFLPLSDKSTPEEIKSNLQISKKAFKKAIGSLYRERLVNLTEDGVRLVS